MNKTSNISCLLQSGSAKTAPRGRGPAWDIAFVARFATMRRPLHPAEDRRHRHRGMQARSRVTPAAQRCPSLRQSRRPPCSVRNRTELSRAICNSRPVAAAELGYDLGQRRGWHTGRTDQGTWRHSRVCSCGSCWPWRTGSACGCCGGNGALGCLQRPRRKHRLFSLRAEKSKMNHRGAECTEEREQA